MIELQAHAKINLSLEVTGQCEDGFHNIVSILQLISLHDTLTFRGVEGEGLHFETDDPFMLAEGENNLVLKAARLLRKKTGTNKGAHISLRKSIPTSAGLGGGSSDAAATLQGLSRLWGIDLPGGELSSLGSMVGSDVPFFLNGPTALVTGRGEQVRPVATLWTFWVVLVCPTYNIPGKTKRLYASLHPEDMSDGAATRQVLDAIERGEYAPSLSLHNSFERAAFEVFDGLNTVHQHILDAMAPNVHLSGSGPTLYILYPETQEFAARRLHERLLSRGLPSLLAQSVTRGW